MDVTINPFVSNSDRSLNRGHVNDKIEKRNRPPITYWGIYLDGKIVSYTSSKELAEQSKIWMEKWLNEKTKNKED
jgi:hypothetical protein